MVATYPIEEGRRRSGCAVKRGLSFATGLAQNVFGGADGSLVFFRKLCTRVLTCLRRSLRFFRAHVDQPADEKHPMSRKVRELLGLRGDRLLALTALYIFMRRLTGCSFVTCTFSERHSDPGVAGGFVNRSDAARALGNVARNTPATPWRPTRYIFRPMFGAQLW